MIGRHPWRALLVLATALACRDDELKLPELPPVDPVPLVLTVSEPASGAFVGERAIVAGKVSDPAAIVWVEGYRVNVGSTGAFRVEVPLTDEFRILDVETARPGPEPGTAEHLRERVVVYAGKDPRETWTGGMGVRVTPTALDHLAEIVEDLVVELDLVAQIDGILPQLGIAGFEFVPVGAFARPPEARLVPGPEGLQLTLSIEDARIRYDIVTTTALGTIPVEVGFEELAFGGTLTIGLDADGALAVGLGATQIDLGTPIFEIAGLDPEILEDWLGTLTAGLGDLLEGVLTSVLSPLLGNFTLPLPDIALPSDLLGFPLSLSLDSAATDLDGVAIGVTVDAGLEPKVPYEVPSAIEAGLGADVAVAIHEGLLQGLLSSDLFALLEQDLELPAFLGEAVALPIGALPGGEQLPGDRTGMCLKLAPRSIGESGLGLARLQDGLSPLATITLPDVGLAVGVSTATAHCAPWIDASLALRVNLNADGTALGASFEVVDGAILSYGAQGSFSEDELVGGLGGLVNVATSFLGDTVAFDLADLLGGLSESELPLGELQPKLLDARPGPTDGVTIVTVSLWD